MGIAIMFLIINIVVYNCVPPNWRVLPVTIAISSVVLFLAALISGGG